MKKRRVAAVPTLGKSIKKQEEEKSKTADILDDDEDENSGFSKWLRTGEGVEFMKYFVILNSLGVFLTLGWPSISKTFHIIRSYFIEDEEQY